MLKNFGYGGVYGDESLSVGVLLENPLEYGLGETNIIFSVTFKVKNARIAKTQLEDFKFYIIDEANCLYNTRSVLPQRRMIEATEDDEPILKPDCLILTDFKHSFLFQDLKIAFYYRIYQKIIIIELNH